MESSDDELANNDTTTTPFRATKHVASTLKSASTKVNGRVPSVPVAGPSSSKPASGASTTTTQKTRARKKRSPSPLREIVEDESDDAEEHAESSHARGNAQEEPIMIDVEPMEVEVVEPPARASRGSKPKRAPSREPEATAPPKTARAQQQRGKGKGKAPNRRHASPGVMDLDTTDNARGEDSDAFVKPSTSILRKEKQLVDAASATMSEKEFAKLQKENERLRNQVEELTRHRNNMANQLDELTNLRHTDAEENLEQLRQHYESRLQAQEEAIAELTQSSDLVKALQIRGKTSSLYFLTHEAAEQEQVPLREEIGRLKGVIDKKSKEVADSEQRVRQLENAVKTLKSDLQAEIENSQRQAKNTQRAPKSDDHKHGWVTKLYEDMTNCLVMSVKEEDSGDISDGPELVYVCIYSTAENKGRGLEFSLRMFKEDHDGEKAEKCLYTPRNLDLEDQEFIDGLGFLSDTFTFWKSQMEVFYERLKSTMSDMSAPTEPEPVTEG